MAALVNAFNNRYVAYFEGNPRDPRAFLQPIVGNDRVLILRGPAADAAVGATVGAGVVSCIYAIAMAMSILPWLSGREPPTEEEYRALGVTPPDPNHQLSPSYFYAMMILGCAVINVLRMQHIVRARAGAPPG